MRKLGLSARAYTRILKLAPTIIDLVGAERTVTTHLNEAIWHLSLGRQRQVVVVWIISNKSNWLTQHEPREDLTSTHMVNLHFISTYYVRINKSSTSGHWGRL